LHRRLIRLGVKNLVVRPRNWDEYGKQVKTDRRDALALVSCLDRYVAGNTEALSSIRIPTEAEERSRSISRQREQMLEHRKRLAAQGLSCARYYGHDLPEEWWRPKKFEALRKELPDFLFGLLGSVQQIALLVHMCARKRLDLICGGRRRVCAGPSGLRRRISFVFFIT
jgi:transposase